MSSDKDCVVVLSGGQDSTTALFIAKQFYRDVHALTFDYGQRHIRELEAAAKVARMAGVKSHQLISLSGGILQSRSPLTAHDTPLETYKDAESMADIIGDRVELTFVPMRNALFATLAANWACHVRASNIVLGVCQEDNANYPDCRASWVSSTEVFINQSLGLERGPVGDMHPIHLDTPLLFKSKAETVALAAALDGCMAALAYSHTAYSGEYPPVTQDHATVLRADGFAKAGLPDPLIVRAWHEGLMDLPRSNNYDHVRTRARAEVMQLWGLD